MCQVRAKSLSYPRCRKRRRRAVAQLGSALDWGSRGRRFKSCQPDEVYGLVRTAFGAAPWVACQMPLIVTPEGAMSGHGWTAKSPPRLGRVTHSSFPAMVASAQTAEGSKSGHAEERTSGTADARPVCHGEVRCASASGCGAGTRSDDHGNHRE